MENKKTNDNSVAMVECPFCNKAIEAPTKVDVIFRCAHCHKELITYDKIRQQKEEEKRTLIEANNKIRHKKQILIWGCITFFISLLLYTAYADKTDMNAIYIITRDYNAAINTEVEKALVRAAVDGDEMKTLEIIGNKQTILFHKGEQVKIVRDVIRGLPSHYRVKRLSDGASALIPREYLIKESD